MNQGLAADLLVVSFFYPPIAEARAIQVGNLLGALEGRALLACAQAPGLRSDPSLAAALPHPESRLLRVPWQPAGLSARLAALARGRGLPLVGRCPDRYRAWIAPARRTILAALESLPWRPQALVSFGQPWSDHLLAQGLAQRLGLPWLAHFSDLWSDWELGQADALTRACNRRLEARVMARAQRLLFTTPETLDLVLAKYPPAWREKAGVLSHSFVPGHYPTEVFQPGNERVIRYLGTFYGQRHPALLGRPLAIIARERPELLRGVRFEIIGDYTPGPETRAALADLPQGLVVFRPPVPHRQGLALMAQAEALLVIEFPHPRSVWLPSKIVEYIGAARPILGLAPAGAARRVIQEAGGACADPLDSQAVAAMLMEHLARPPQASPWGAAAVRAGWTARERAGQFRDEISRLVEGHPGPRQGN